MLNFVKVFFCISNPFEKIHFMKTKQNMRHICKKSQTFSQIFSFYFHERNMKKMRSFKQKNLFSKKCKLFAKRIFHILGKPHYNTFIKDYIYNWYFIHPSNELVLLSFTQIFREMLQVKIHRHCFMVMKFIIP